MKLAKSEPVVTHEGDRVAVTITHNIKINGDDSWVKYELETKVHPGEDLAEVDNRVIEHAAKTVVRLAERAATEVVEYTPQMKLEN
jgi:hypothetical protein